MITRMLSAEPFCFLRGTPRFWRDFISGQGEVELVANHTFVEEPAQGGLSGLPAPI